MAIAPDRAQFFIEIVPEFRKGYFSVMGEVVEAGIRANWYALSKRIHISFNIESSAMSKALARAEWLART